MGPGCRHERKHSACAGCCLFHYSQKGAQKGLGRYGGILQLLAGLRADATRHLKPSYTTSRLITMYVAGLNLSGCRRGLQGLSCYSKNLYWMLDCFLYGKTFLCIQNYQDSKKTSLEPLSSVCSSAHFVCAEHFF